MNLQTIERPARLPQAKARRDWYTITNIKSDEAEVYIYDEIGYWGVTASDFVRDLQAVKAKSINLHLNTPGGDVFDGIAIYTALKQHSASVNVQIDSLAASIGSVIAMAGDKITMARFSTLMIHDPYGLAVGNAEDMSKMAEVLDQLGDTIAGVYAERAGGSVREWRGRMLEETWYTDREAVDAGLADGVFGDESDTVNACAFDLSMFKHPPDHLSQSNGSGEPPTKRNIERALRDAGLTRHQAKAFVAAAYQEIEREDPTRDAEELIALRDALKILTGGK